MAVPGVAAGACLIAPRTRLIGCGLLLGAAATTPSTPWYAVILLADGDREPGAGLWQDLVGSVVLTLSALVVVVAVARTDAVCLTLRHAGVFSWLVILIACVGAIALFTESQGHIAGRNDGFDPAEDSAPLILASTMALVLPTVAAFALPRLFGVALLAGWVGCGASVVVFNTGLETSTVFGYTLLAFLAVIIPFARTGPASAGIGRTQS